MIWELLRSTRDLGRLQQIASILVRFGFGDVAHRLGMADALTRAGATLHWDGVGEFARLEPPERVRRALEELGTTFIKLGQILSTRVDLFPPQWITEFEKLQDHAAPVAYEEIRAQLEEDLKANPDHVFDALEPVPLAAASIAQVHTARLHDGTPVVLKIRRPGIVPIVEADLRLLGHLAEIAEKDGSISRFRPVALVKQLTQSLRRELDLSAESRNAERISGMFAHDLDRAGQRTIVVPRVYWEWTNARMNVQEHIKGIAGRDMETVDAVGLDRNALARRGAQAMFRMMLKEGFFHADPHPGNVFYLPANRLALIDFGMVGRLTPRRREQVVDLLFGLARRDSETVAELLVEWAGGMSVDVDMLAQDVGAFTDQFYGLSLEQIDLGRLLTQLTEIMRDHNIALPPDLALLFKAAISLEGLGRILDPSFHIVQEATPFLQEIAAERMSPQALARRGMKELKQTLKLAADLPGGVRRLVNIMRSGRATVNINVPELREFGDRLDKSANRLTMGIVTAALIIGSSIVMTVGDHSSWFGPSLLGMAGFVAAILCGVWVLWSMRHSRKRR